MLYLLAASLIWAFSFGLIKHVLVAPGIDPSLIGLIRLLLSAALFAAFLRPRRIAPGTAVRLIGIGAIQYGLMYLAYLHAYRFLSGHEVALFTVFTPLYVTLISDLLVRRFRRLFLLTSLLAVAGGAVVYYRGGPAWSGAATGFLLMQASNLCFAFGQIAYRRCMGVAAGEGNRTGGRAGCGASDREVFALLYLGASLAVLPPACVTIGRGDVVLSPAQIWTLLYLGLVPSGLCFFLWNAGARRVSAGTLAVFNNAKIPLAVLSALAIFGEAARMAPLLVGGVLIVLAFVINERSERR